MAVQRRTLFETSSIFLLGLILFTCNLSSQEIIGFDSRFYLFAQEMLHYGITWFPTTYQHPYPDYPATGIILIYFSAKLLGALTKLSAVLPTAICAALTLVLTYLIGSLHAKRWGLYAVFFMLLTLTFFTSARSISLDMYPTLFTTACFYLIYTADKKQLPHLIWFVFPLLFCSFLFRGPIGLVVPAGVISIYFLLTKQFRKFVVIGFLAFVLLCISTALLLQIAHHSGGSEFMHAVLRMQIIGRIDNPYLPRDFYFINSLKMYALAYPVALLVLVGVALSSKEAKDAKFILILFGWMLVVLFGMSIPDDKKERYILEMTPAIALLAAYPYFAPEHERYFKILRTLLNTLFLSLPLLFMLGLVYLHQYAVQKPLFFDVHYVCMFILFGAFQIANFIINRRHQHAQPWRETLLLGSATLCFVIANIAVLEPVQQYLDQTREFVVATETQRLRANAKLVFYKESPDGTAIKYLINMYKREQPIFINDDQSLLSYPAPAFFVTSTEFYLQLPKAVTNQFHRIGQGQLGHVPVIVFERN